VASQVKVKAKIINENPVNIKGDINGDGKVDSIDCAMLKRHLLEITQLSEDVLLNADVTGDGVIDSRDYTLMTRFVLEIISSF
jgi:hypothetical protein